MYLQLLLDEIWEDREKNVCKTLSSVILKNICQVKNLNSVQFPPLLKCVSISIHLQIRIFG